MLAKPVYILIHHTFSIRKIREGEHSYRSPALCPYLIASSKRGMFARTWTLSNPETMAQNNTCARLEGNINTPLYHFCYSWLTISLHLCHVVQQWAKRALRDRQKTCKVPCLPQRLCWIVITQRNGRNLIITSNSPKKADGCSWRHPGSE